MEGMKMFLFCKAELTRTQLSPSLKSGGFSVGFSVENRLLEYSFIIFIVIGFWNSFVIFFWLTTDISYQSFL